MPNNNIKLKLGYSAHSNMYRFGPYDFICYGFVGFFLKKEHPAPEIFIYASKTRPREKGWKKVKFKKVGGGLITEYFEVWVSGKRFSDETWFSPDLRDYLQENNIEGYCWVKIEEL